MTTKAKNTKVTKMIMPKNVGTQIIKETECRYIHWLNKKYYYVCDLEEAIGKTKVATVEDNIVKQRVTYNGNSQTRRLIAASNVSKLISK